MAVTAVSLLSNINTTGPLEHRREGVTCFSSEAPERPAGPGALRGGSKIPPGGDSLQSRPVSSSS